MLDGLGGKGLKSDHETGRIGPRVDREVRAIEVRSAAQRAREVPDEREVRHLFEYHRDDARSPTLHGLFLLDRPARIRPLEAEGCVEVAAHELVLDLGGLVEPIEKLLSAR